MSRRPLACAVVLTAILALAGLSMVAAACGSGSGGSSPSVTPVATPTGPTTSSSPSQSASPGVTPKATPTPAAGKGTVIAVASGPAANALSAVTPAGSYKLLVGAKGGPIHEIAWSPDRANIAYVQAKSASDYSGPITVYTVATGKTSQPLVGGSVPYAVVGYTWVAPNQFIASVFKTKGATYHVNGTLYLFDIAKGTTKPVKDDAGHVVHGIDPSSSSDAMEIAFVRYGSKSGGLIKEDLALLDADTLGVSVVAHGVAPVEVDGDSFSYPAISPDGSLIATSQTGSDVGFGLTVYRVDGTLSFRHANLTWPTRTGWDPSVGSRLVYGAGGPTTVTDSLYVERPGARWKVLTLANRVIADPAFSPDGKNIAYCMPSLSGPTGDLYVVSSGVGSPHLLLKNADWPAWALAKVPGL